MNVTFNKSTPPTLADKAFSDLSKVYAIVPKGCTSSYSSIGFKQITEKNEDYPLVTINLTDAGTLQEMALDIEETDIRNLKLVGPVNSADINHLRTSARFTNISYLDMSDVVLIADNNSYCSSKDFGNFYLSDVNYSYPITYNSGLGFYSVVNQFYGNSFAGVFIGMKVKEVILPSHLTRIGAYCFANCTELQKIVIPDGVTTIEEGAFLGCNSLTEIKLPSSVTKISKYAFYQCVALQIASLDNVTQIGSSAFSQCESLRYVGSLAKVKNIEEASFADCSSLVGEIDLSGVPVISKNAFARCASLSNVIFSENLQSIGESAFAKCTNLRSVNLPESTKAVMPEAFYGCTRLSVVSYSRNLLQVAKSTFTDTPFFASLECVDGIKYMGHIAMCIEGDPVSRISFREGTLSIADDFIYTSSNKDYKTVCTELLLPNSLLRIGNYAFTKGGRYSYEGLGITKLSLPENLLEIGDNAFSYSKSISQITLPESLIYVGNAAFYGCEGLVRVIYNASSLMSNISSSRSIDVHGIFEGTGIEKVTIGPKVRILPSAVFMGCEKLMKVEFADRTSDDHLYVGPYSFYSCKALTNIVLPESTDSIGIYAFRYCRALSNVTLPDSIQRVGELAFEDCPWLDTYLNNQPDGVAYVGLVAFGYKGNMPEGTTISLREGTKSIAYMAFYHCDGMEHLIIPNTVESIGDYAFMGCRNLKSIKMGTGIISIGDCAFENCNALSSIELPEYVKTIGASAFRTCRNLKTITIGSNVTEIGDVAFYGLENISDVTVLRENPEDYNCSNAVFESHGVGVIYIGTTYYSHPENATLHVPEGCVEAYKNCYPWCRFGTIVDDAITSVLQPTIEIMPLNESRTYDNTFIYDLQGRRVTNPQKGGVYIIGGKKVIK